jgi:hypothetical protein
MHQLLRHLRGTGCDWAVEAAVVPSLLFRRARRCWCGDLLPPPPSGPSEGSQPRPAAQESAGAGAAVGTFAGVRQQQHCGTAL